MSHLSLQQLRKTYGQHKETITGVDLEIRDGEFMVFVGPSGCGKSTMLRMIAGLEDISAGALYIGDKHVNDLEPSERGIGMVFQSYALYPHMTVRDNMGFSLKLKGTPKAQIAAEVERVADILQIQPLLDRLPKALSGGQRQRVAIGRAIVRNPKVFLFDEPLSNLDASLRVQMRIELTKLHKALKATMIYVTHDQVEAMTMADRIVVFNAGKIEQVGTPLELYQKPCNLFVATFLGSPKINLIQTQSVAASSPEQGWRIALPGSSVWTLDRTEASGLSGGEVTIGIRPEHVSLQPLEGAVSVQALFEVAEHLGDTQIGYFRVEGSPEPWSVKFAANEAMPAYGAPAELWMDRSHAHVFDRHGLAVH